METAIRLMTIQEAAGVLAREHRKPDTQALLWVTEGRGKMILGYQTLVLQPYRVVLWKPELPGNLLELPEAGWYLHFDSWLLRSFLAAHPAEEMGFFLAAANAVPFVNLVQDQQTVLSGLVRVMQLESKLHSDWQILQSYLYIFLLHLAKTYRFRNRMPLAAAEVTELRRFEKIVDGFYQQEHGVGFYAAELGISVQKLNRLCRKATGVPAGELILRKVLTECERLLVYTDMRLKEIAYQLNFSNPAYFTRFFKKRTGWEPSAFRRRIQADSMINPA